MIIVCPQCESRYEIAESFLRPEGRTVRCARCRSEWEVFAPPVAEPLPSDPEAAWMDAAAPEATEPEAQDTDAVLLHGLPDFDATAAAPDSIEAVAEREASPLRTHRGRVRRRSLRRLLPSGASAALVAGLAALVGLAQYRNSVVAAFPGTASLYALAHMPVNRRGLAFEGVQTSAASEGGAPVLVLSGEIRNVTRTAVPVPALRLAIRDENGAEIYGWTAAPGKSVLEPGASMPFKSRLASPPAEGRSVLVRFAAPGSVVADNP